MDFYYYNPFELVPTSFLITRQGFEIVSEVVTRPTGANGVRYSEWSRWDKVTAPACHVINQRTVKVEWLSRAGSENNYELVYEDEDELIPGTGLTYPRTLRVRTFARSPRGHASGRGWSRIKVTGSFIKYC